MKISTATDMEISAADAPLPPPFAQLQFKLAVPLARAAEIYWDAYGGVSGLCRTVREPCMSGTSGKVTIDGVSEIAGEKAFVLRLIQARDLALAGRHFFARFDPQAVWLTDLQPALAPQFPFA